MPTRPLTRRQCDQSILSTVAPAPDRGRWPGTLLSTNSARLDDEPSRIEDGMNDDSDPRVSPPLHDPGKSSVIGRNITRIGQPKLQWNKHHRIPLGSHAARPNLASWPRQKITASAQFLTQDVADKWWNPCGKSPGVRTEGMLQEPRGGTEVGLMVRASARITADAVVMARSRR